MRRFLLLSVILGWSLSAEAQAPLVDCMTTYDCCVKRHGAVNCAPGAQGAVRRAAEDAVNMVKAGSHEPDVTLASALDGGKLSSLLEHLARHLARILELEQVGGIPPEEAPREQAKRHWWAEVKTAVKNIRQALKRCKSRRQMISALRSAASMFTEAQIADIETRLLQAAEKMGDEVDELITCGKE